MPAKKPLVFRGIAHPPPKTPRDHASDLSAGEMLTTNLNSLPLHVEHDTSKPPVGACLASYVGSRGELKVLARVTDAATAAKMEKGELRGLSLGTDVILGMDGEVLSRKQTELSVCEEGRRSGTWIETINNKTVHTVEAFSKRGVTNAPF